MKDQTGGLSGTKHTNQGGTHRLFLAFVLVSAALGLWWAVFNESRGLQAQLLEHARLVARAVEPNHIQELSASQADLASEHYQRIKEQLTGVHTAAQSNRFVYLLRQRPDGSIIFLADSKPPASKDYSPPGQEYQEAPAEIGQLFASGRESVVGPYSDRWGRWISALAPVTDPKTGRTVALLGMDTAAGDWIWLLVRGAARDLAMILLFIVPLAVYVVLRRRSERSLRQSRDEWQNTFDSMPDPIAILDKEHRIIRANRAMRDRLEQGGGSIIGQHCYHHVHRSDAPPEFCPHARLLKDGGSHAEETHLPSLEGDYAISVTPLHDADGLLAGSIHIAHNITARKRAEDALRESEALHREAQVVAGLGTYYFNIADGTWQSSDILDGIFGIDANFDRTMEGWKTLIHPEDREMMTQHLLDEVLDKYRRFDREYRIIRQDDARELWVHGQGRLEFDEQGQPSRMIGTIMNITDHKRAEDAVRASKDHYKALYRLIRLMCDNVPDLIWAKDMEQRYIFANKAMCEILLNATDPEEPLGRTDLYFAERERAAHPEHPDWHTFGELCMDTDSEVMSARSAMNFDESGNVKGRFLSLDVTKAPFIDEQGTMIGTVGCGRDVTLVKQMEESLHRKNAEIEQFIYTVSHDLRSPLVTVKTFLGYLEQDLSSGDSERIGADMEFMHAAADRMEILLNELLDMSRIGRASATMDKVSFQELATEALEAAAGQINTGGVEVRVSDANPPLYGDRRRLLQIWQNLLDNSLKYLGDQAQPCIHIGVEQHPEETVFFVCDNGIGIEPVFHEKIFGIFEQLDRQKGGVGMGLTMIKRIVEMYGGQIRVESEGVGTGSCFRFTLPEAVSQPRNISDAETTLDQVAYT